MELIKPSRRGFLLGLLAAPVIVKASSLMPIKGFDLPREGTIRSFTFTDHGYTEVFQNGVWRAQAQWVTWHRLSPQPVELKDYFSTLRDARLSA